MQRKGGAFLEFFFFFCRGGSRSTTGASRWRSNCQLLAVSPQPPTVSLLPPMLRRHLAVVGGCLKMCCGTKEIGSFCTPAALCAGTSSHTHRQRCQTALKHSSKDHFRRLCFVPGVHIHPLQTFSSHSTCIFPL